MEATNQSSRAEPVDDGQSHLTPQLVDTSLVVGRIVQVNDESVLELITKQEKWITLKVRLLCVILGGLVIIAHNTVCRSRHSVTHVTPVWRLGPAHYEMLQRPWTWMESSEWPSVHSCMWDIDIKMYLGCEHLNCSYLTEDKDCSVVNLPLWRWMSCLSTKTAIRRYWDTLCVYLLTDLEKWNVHKGTWWHHYMCFN